MKQVVLRLLREPLLQFFVVGGLFFLLFSLGDASEDPASTVILISPERVDQLSAQFSSTWNRQPTEDELENIIDGYIREEVYYRDALALGLDQNDTVIGSAVNKVVANVVQDGFWPDPDTGDKKIDIDLKERWKAWACDRNECDIQGERDFATMTALACTTSSGLAVTLTPTSC